LLSSTKLSVLSPLLDGSGSPGTLFGCGSRLELTVSLRPTRPLDARHLADHELTRGNLLAHPLEFLLSRLTPSLQRVCHRYLRL
jgi:hypothetical protein